MKDYDFKIKIADFLQQSGTKDTLVFEQKFSTKIPHLSEEGISCTIEIIGLDSKTLLITVKKGIANITTECDSCGSTTITQITMPEEAIKVYVGESRDLEAEDVIILDTQEGVIDLEEYLVDSFLLQDTVVHICEKCVDKERSDLNEEDQGGTIEWKFSTKS